MTDDASIPTRRAELDVLVLWAVAVLQPEAGYVGSGDIEAMVASKCGVDPRTPIGLHEAKAIRRALERLLAGYLVQFDTSDGYRLGPEND
jgi:hypothetical protein